MSRDGASITLLGNLSINNPCHGVKEGLSGKERGLGHLQQGSGVGWAHGRQGFAGTWICRERAEGLAQKQMGQWQSSIGNALLTMLCW